MVTALKLNYLRGRFYLCMFPISLLSSYFTELSASLSVEDGRILDEMLARIQKVRLALTGMGHLWLQSDIRLSMKGRV